MTRPRAQWVDPTHSAKNPFGHRQAVIASDGVVFLETLAIETSCMANLMPSHGRRQQCLLCYHRRLQTIVTCGAINVTEGALDLGSHSTCLTEPWTTASTTNSSFEHSIRCHFQFRRSSGLNWTWGRPYHAA